MAQPGWRDQLYQNLSRPRQKAEQREKEMNSECQWTDLESYGFAAMKRRTWLQRHGSARAESITSHAWSVLEPQCLLGKSGVLLRGRSYCGKKREVISQDHFRHPHLGTSPGPQDLRAQQFRKSQTAPNLPQGTAPGETWLLRACVWQQG